MATRDHYTPGTPSWIDLMSPDVDASTAFYTELFGWDAEDQHDDEGTRIYTMFKQDGRDIAGLGGQMPGMDSMPPMWNSYVATDDCEETVARAEKAGGTVVAPPMKVMDSGSMAIVQDPAGAVISIWQADQHIGATLVNEPNALAWNELLSRDLEGVTDFYADTFGWSFEDDDMGTLGIYRLAKVGDDRVAGMMTMPAEMPDQVPSFWNVYFSVEDVDQTCVKAKELGGQVVMEPMDSPAGRLATLHDAQGGSFSILRLLDYAS